MPFNPDLLGRLSEALDNAPGPLSVELHREETDPPWADELGAVANELRASLGDRVVVEERRATHPRQHPGLSVSCGDRGGITYLALPEGPEAEPFAEALITLATGATDPLPELDPAAELVVFIAGTCHHCPGAVSAATAIAAASPAVSVTVVDAQRFPELAAEAGVVSVPLTVIDGELSLEGVISREELVERIAVRAPEDRALQVLKAHIESGRAADAASALRSGAGPQLVTLWLSSTTADRIGLMMAAEEALELDPGCLRDIASDLVPALASPDAALRGDTVDLLGQIGNPVVAEAIAPLTDDPNPDVAEIAAEALEQLSQEGRPGS